MAHPSYVRKFLDASISHISPACSSWLSDQAQAGEYASFTVADTTYGYLFYASDDHPISEFEELEYLRLKAREHDCDYVLLDRDAEEIEGLPTFEW